MWLILPFGRKKTQPNLKPWSVLYANNTLDKPPEWELEGGVSLSLFLYFSSNGRIKYSAESAGAAWVKSKANPPL